MKRWYAVQVTSEDAWDYGSYDYEEAVRMAKRIAKENGSAIIARINEVTGFCESEEVIEA